MADTRGYVGIAAMIGMFSGLCHVYDWGVAMIVVSGLTLLGSVITPKQTGSTQERHTGLLFACVTFAAYVAGASV